MNSKTLDKDFQRVIDDFKTVKNVFLVTVPKDIKYHCDVVRGVWAKEYHPNEIDYSYKLMGCTKRHLTYWSKCLLHDSIVSLFDMFAFLVSILYWIATMHPVYSMFGAETIQWIRISRSNICRFSKRTIFRKEISEIEEAKQVACPRCNKQLLNINLISLTGWCFDCSAKEFKPKE